MQYLDLFMTSLKTHYEKDERSGIHVSDLTMCIRKTILRKMNPTPITPRELNFFTSGRAIHDAIQTIAKVNEGMFEIEKEVSLHMGDSTGIIQGHVDLYDIKNNVPIECKSSRTKEMKTPKKFHVDQLKYYMAMLDADNGKLFYQCLMHFDDHPFFEFEITMDKDERVAKLELMKALGDVYKRNLDAKTPFNVAGVMDDPDLNWLCKSCPYLEQCKKDKEEKQKK